MLVFALMVWLVPHPIRWFRIVAVIALLISLIPDLLLGFGGDLRRTGSAMVSPSPVSGRSSFPRRRVADHRPAAHPRRRSSGCPGPGADPDGVARGHRGSLHRAADDADAGANCAAIAWHAIFELRPYREGAPETSRSAR